MLELAVLGLLHESPMHGYELRKRLSALLGPVRAAFSYGSLYPTLRRLRETGWISEQAATTAPPGLVSKRAKVVYALTAEGKERFVDLLARSGPETYDDEGFGVHFAFFARTDSATRLRILEGRRRRMEDRREGLRETLARTRDRLDAYTLELQRHGLESTEREVRWLSEMIDSERAGRPPRAEPSNSAGTSGTPGTSSGTTNNPPAPGRDNAEEPTDLANQPGDQQQGGTR